MKNGYVQLNNVRFEYLPVNFYLRYSRNLKKVTKVAVLADEHGKVFVFPKNFIQDAFACNGPNNIF